MKDGRIWRRKHTGNKLTAIMQVRNEQGRYLEAVLAELSQFVDDIVIVDDASTDDTHELCRSFDKVVKLIRLDTSLFRTEWQLRQRLWEEAITLEPDWILSVDADEIYEQRAALAIRELIDQDRYDWVGYRMYDFWGSLTHYREDEWWTLHKRHTMTLIRYLPGYHYYYPQWEHHVPRLPITAAALPGICTEFRIKHLGWAGSEEDRRAKYERYKQLDPFGKWGSLAHYESILDPKPRLIRWNEEASQS
ncbi:glycosyltransferase [Paenibacillus sinopodophylli]|uniref:glycosyltransferase n=1 Tax=Paenibacillus sinopodophylli TaxID=1837342 RepID=UPI00110CC223|nr:glycosyltransferase [Paenibacillus sinopodophylli]